MLTVFPEELRRQILAGKAVEALVAGLGRDDESVQTACKDALLDLVQHGPFVYYFVIRDVSLITWSHRRWPGSSAGCSGGTEPDHYAGEQSAFHANSCRSCII